MKAISQEISDKFNNLDVTFSAVNSSFETINLEVTNLISEIENDEMANTQALKDAIFASKQDLITIVQNFNNLLDSITDL